MSSGRTSPIGSLFIQPPRLAPAPARPAIVPVEETAPATGTLAVSEKRTRQVVQMASRGEVDAFRLQENLGISQGAANAMLSRLARAGHLKRVQAGRYIAGRAKR